MLFDQIWRVDLIILPLLIGRLLSSHFDLILIFFLSVCLSVCVCVCVCVVVVVVVVVVVHLVICSLLQKFPNQWPIHHHRCPIPATPIPAIQPIIQRRQVTQHFRRHW